MLEINVRRIHNTSFNYLINVQIVVLQVVLDIRTHAATKVAYSRRSKLVGRVLQRRLHQPAILGSSRQRAMAYCTERRNIN